MLNNFKLGSSHVKKTGSYQISLFSSEVGENVLTKDPITNFRSVCQTKQSLVR